MSSPPATNRESRCRTYALPVMQNNFMHIWELFKNLVCLDKEVIKKNLPKALPANWISGTEKVTWNPGVLSEPPREWLQLIWKFLQQDLHSLSPFEGYPLLPLSSLDNGPSKLSLARLRQKSSLLFQNSDGHILADNTVKMLETVGCTVIHHWDSQLWHKTLFQFIMTPTSNNILKAFSNLGLGIVLLKLMEMTTEQKKLLCNLLSQASIFSTDELNILSQLPIFCKLSSLQGPGSQLVPAHNARALDKVTVPAIPRDLVLPETILICRDEKDQRLLLQMGVQFLGAADVAAVSAVAIRNGQYVDHQKQAERIMLWILRNGEVLFSQNKNLRKTCESFSFVPCNCELVSPSALFDPHVETFWELFKPQMFPPKEFHEPQILKSLRTLGLKASLENITPEDILQVAEEISKSQPFIELQDIERRARALIRVCNDTLVLSRCDSRNIETLRRIAWVPGTALNSKTTFFKPMELRRKNLSPLVEYSMPITDEFNEVASNILGLSDSPPAEKIIENLTMLSHQYTKVDYYTFVMKLHTIYKYMQDSLTQFENMLHLIKIWNSDGFSDPSEILLSYPEGLDLSCQIKKVPESFLIYRKLFLKCGVHETISDVKVFGVLHELMRDMQKRKDGGGTSKELKLVISVLEWMKTRGLHSTDSLPVPVHSLTGLFTLKPLSSAVFCDMPKEHLKDLDETPQHNIVHEDISYTTATFMKLPLLSTKILKPEYFEPWGPSEPITLRIKNILREYSEEADLFKEMIQNADDAGATVCHFLVDTRQNLKYRNSLLDPAMASCHGPALWSYNNRKFSNEDFRNITRVGAATKELQVEKIGKFGLGFNTVYRVTDVPSILSGDSVLIFDPNANHLRKHIQSEANPGIKINLCQHPHVFQLFSDQFYPYQNVFGCDLKTSLTYDGTLIRLPFRTEEEAKVSKICNQSFNDHQLQQFMNIVQNSSKNVLVFLKGVQEVSLSILSQESPSPSKPTLKLKLCRKKAHNLTIPDGFLLQSKQITVASAVAGKNVLDVQESTIIKVSVSKNSATHAQHYLLHSSYGIGESLEMFQNNKQKKTVFSLPFAAIALPLMKNVHTGKWRPDLEGFDGQVFCFLPLPIFSGLPFHLNASFAAMSNRKNLWGTTEKGEWNRKLLCDAVLVTLARALVLIQQMHQDGNLECYTYHTFWPDIRKTKSTFVEALKGFYRAVATGLNDSLLELFCNGQTWCTIAHACFLISDIVENKQVGKTASQVFSMLLPPPFVAVSLPEWVKAGFQGSDCDEILLQNTYNWERFYKEIVFKNLHCLAAKDRDVLIIHAIDMNNKEVDELLKAVPCIPSTPSGKLQLISNLVHSQGKVALLFEKEKDPFLQGTQKTYLRPDRLSRLELLGMLKDRIPMIKLMERAGTIVDVWQYDQQKACRRIRHVLELLKDLIAQAPSNIDQAAFRYIAFLPAILPRCTNVQQNPEIIINKPTEIFHYKHLSLVNLSEPVLSKEHVGKEFTFSAALIEFLGLTSIPHVQTVMLQLEEAHKKNRFLSKEEISSIVKKCYIFLNKVLQDRPNVWNEVRNKAATFPFVLMGQQCVPLTSVAQTLSFEAAPYLYQLPNEYKQFDKLWQCVSLRDTFAIEDYITVLKNIARKHNGKRVPKYELDLALNIIKRISEETTNGADFSLYEAQGMVLPDRDGILRSADKLHYNDTPWLPCDNDTILCHELIPRTVALRFKVQTKIHKALKNLNISPLSRWVSTFGSKENLTRRIKNIISEYSSKKDILKEFIQNADDSGATELHFVWDPRTHPAKRTFGNEWKPMQGPALCIYNNTLFTDEDIDGIQELGRGGKGNKLDTTGKYGLGFNVVYHLTDCPSFVTGDSMLCIFDPNLMFLKTSSCNSPGAQLAVNHEFKTTFPDVYSTFLPDKFDLEHGTVFRLPLRTAETVAKSHISNQTVTSHDISELCDELQRDANNLILFLNNIQTITFSNISEKDGECQRIFSISTKMSSNSKIDHVAFRKKLHEFAHAEAPMNEGKPYQVFFTVEVKCSWSSISTKWIVAKQIGFEGEASDVCRVCEGLKCLCLRHGAVAACMNNSVPGRAFCTLPLPVETGLPVHINGNFIVDSARRDICKEDGGSAKTEWNSLLLTHLLAPLYCDLLECLRISLIQSKDGPLEFVNFQACECFLNSKFLYFFPHITENIPPMWQKMVSQVYRSVHEKQIPLIPVYNKKTIKLHTIPKDIVTVEWTAVSKETVIEQPHFLLHELNREKEQALQKINMRLVLPFDYLQRIFMEFKNADVPVLLLSPEAVCTYLRIQTLQPEWQNLPLLVSETLFKSEACCHSLLKYCLKVDRNELGDCLNGLPLLVTIDGKLRRLCKIETKYHTRFSGLFPSYQHMFTNNKVVEDEIALLLEEAGFLEDFSIEESAEFIKEHLGQRFCLSKQGSSTELELAGREELWMKNIWMFFQSKICKKISDDEPSSKLFQVMVSLFSDWSILPVSFEHKPGTFLFPLVSLKEVVNDPDSSNGVVTCLLKLGLAKLNAAFMPFEIFYHWIKPRLLQTVDCASVLDILQARTGLLQWTKLTDWENESILRYLVTGLSSTKNKTDFIYKLQYMPLFETIQGGRQSLNVYKKRYILDTKLLKDHTIFQELYQMDAQTVFLCDCSINKELAVDLNIEVINDLQFLVRFLLPLLSSMQEKQLLQVLKLVQCIKKSYTTEFEFESKTIFTSLGSMQFIRDEQGILQRPSYFYDCECIIFKMFEHRCRFIPEAFFKQLGYSFIKIKTILLGLGTRYNVSDNDFIRYATEVEKDAKRGVSMNLLEPKINELFSHLIQLRAEDLTHNFMNRVCIIRFLHPACITSDLQNLHPPYSSSTPLIPLKGSLWSSFNGHDMLVWTSMAILLQTEYVPSMEEKTLLKDLGVIFDPPLKSVLQNIKNVCQVKCKSNELLQIRFDVLEKSYNFLQRNLPFDSSPLNGVPVILVEDNALAEPDKVVFSLHEDLVFRPYLFSVHSQMSCFRILFQNLGVEAEPTVFHYGKVLNRIYDETKEKESPHGNQMKTLLKTTENLFLLLKEGKTKKDLQMLKPLYLPASDGRLYDSSTLVFNNLASTRELSCLESTFKFLVHIENCNLFNDPYELEELLQQLPEDIKPKMLSQVITESIHSMPLCSLGDSCELKTQLYGLLSSSAFQEALVSLLRSQNKGQTSAEEATQQCSGVFKKLEIICCEKIQTVLLNGSETVQGSCQSKNVFIEKGRDGQCRVCIMHKDVMSVQETVCIMTSLAEEINGIMMNVLSRKSTLILLQILTCKCSQEMSNVMNNHGILTQLTKSKAAFSLPLPGQEVPGEWYDSLDMSITNSFKVGDYVAFLDPSKEDTYLYAVIQAKLESRVCGDVEVEMFLIDLGPGHIIPVCILDLYQFKIIINNSSKEQAIVKTLEEVNEHQNEWFKKSLGDIKTEIDEKMCEMWKLSKKEKIQSIRRLYLQYHPDKNRGREKLANEICKYIQQKIKDLEENKLNSTCYSNKPHHSSSGFSKYWNRWDDEASQHRQYHEDFARRSNCEYDFWGYHDQQQRKPRPEEADRWLQQAECDLRAVSNDVDHDSPEWVLYKIHQAIKKALIAALCKKPGIFETELPISDMASKVSTFCSSLEDVQQKVNELERLGVDDKKTQYPNYHPTPQIPNNSFPSEQEDAVLQLATNVLDKINAYVHT